MQNSRNSVTLINIEHVLHLKAAAALRIVGNILHFFPQDFLLHSFHRNFPVKVWTQIDFTFATPIFWRQEMTSDHPLIHFLKQEASSLIYFISPVLNYTPLYA